MECWNGERHALRALVKKLVIYKRFSNVNKNTSDFEQKSNIFESNFFTQSNKKLTGKFPQIYNLTVTFSTVYLPYLTIQFKRVDFFQTKLNLKV